MTLNVCVLLEKFSACALTRKVTPPPVLIMAFSLFRRLPFGGSSKYNSIDDTYLLV